MPSKTLTAPVMEGGLLAQVLDTWKSKQWDPAALAGFRMEDDPDNDDVPPELEDLSDEELDALEDLSEDDVDALDALSDEDLEKLRTARSGNQLTEAREQARKNGREAAKRRRELKPWKDIGREFGMTADEVREHLERTIDDDDRDRVRDDRRRGDKDRDRDRDRDREDRRRRERERAARRETEEAANKRILRSEIKAIAALDRVGFADPQDAPLYLNLSDYDVDEDGEVDVELIIDDLKQVLEDKPHLAKSTERKRPKPDRGQGTRRSDKDKGVDAGREMFESRRPKREPREKANA